MVRVAHGSRTVDLATGERVTIDAGASWSKADSPAPAVEDDSAEREPNISDDKTAPKQAAGGAGAADGASAAAWMRRADDARAAGRLGDAASALRALIAQHPRDRRVTHALFTLGGIERQRGRHAAAARAFQRGGNALQGDAIAEAATSWTAAGNHARARAAASRYLQKFPEGVHARQMRSLGSP